MAAVDRRQQIIEVAVDLFSRRGFQGTTTREIAQAAGVNEATIFRHFATKSDLYAAIIDWKACSEDFTALERALETTLETGDDSGLFELVALRMLEINDADQNTMRLMLYSGLEGHELSEIFFRNHIVRIFHALAGFIRRRVDEGSYRQVDPMTAVRSFIGMVHYHAMTTKLFPHQVNELLNISNRQAAERFADIFIASMLNLEYGRA
jgi:AcrR family transcriptional regulator